ncbi:unnamed protein product [Ambrosiozyma monospora]|uniref:Unnamed protein product n=1 Tax=Ambrosiozyma monospora TaxID=43982 RepID=A0ACB5TS90_AMBMO|nr:unnamed protein product [Ambrosiozyma monospora]
MRLHKYEKPLEDIDQSLLAFSAVSYCTPSPGSDTALPQKSVSENNHTNGSSMKGNDNAITSNQEQQPPKLKSIMKAPFSSDRRPNSVATELSSKKSVTFEETEPTAKEKRDQNKGSHLSVISCKLFKGLVLRPGHKSDQVPPPNRLLKNDNDNISLGMDICDNYECDDDQVQAYCPDDRISMEQQLFEPDHQSPPDDERSSNMDEVVESSLRLKPKQLEQLKRKTSETAFLFSSSPTTSLNSHHCVNKKQHLPVNTPCNQRQSSLCSNGSSNNRAMAVRKTRNAMYDPSGMLDIHQIDSQLKLLKKKKRQIRKQTASNYFWKLFGWSGSKETTTHDKKQPSTEQQHDGESSPLSILSFEDEHGTATYPGTGNPLTSFLSNELQQNSNNGTGSIIHHFNGNNNRVGIGIGIIYH